MGLLTGKFIVVGVTGGIAAYRTCELTRLLVKDGAEVQALLTQSAAELVGPLTFQALCGRPAEVGRGGLSAKSGMEHIDFGRRADLIVIAPLTANTLAKLSQGLADNLLTSTVLASTCPIVLAPAMNTRMWMNPITIENVARLRELPRMIVVGPGSGGLACGEEGEGRMEEPEVIHQAIRDALAARDLAGLKILVTAGPTREPLDPVRYLSNRSSGKMGFAIAAAAHRRGALVILVSGPTGLRPPHGVELVPVTTADEMGRAVDRHFAPADVVIMAAAVADFRARKVAREKIKKGAGIPTLELAATRDILASLGRKKKRQLLIGFAAETADPEGAAREKLRKKRCDLIVANDVSRSDAGFDVDTNQVLLVDLGGSESLPLLPKTEVAERVLDRVRGMLKR